MRKISLIGLLLLIVSNLTFAGDYLTNTNQNAAFLRMIQTRLLVLRVKLEGLNAQLVESLNGVINGIAISRDLDNAFLDNGTTNRFPALKSGYVNYTLGLSPTDGYYTGDRRLLGLDGVASQILTLNITYKGNVQKVYIFNITNDLNGFHTKDVVQPCITL